MDKIDYSTIIFTVGGFIALLAFFQFLLQLVENRNQKKQAIQR